MLSFVCPPRFRRNNRTPVLVGLGALRRGNEAIPARALATPKSCGWPGNIKDEGRQEDLSVVISRLMQNTSKARLMTPIYLPLEVAVRLGCSDNSIDNRRCTRPTI